MYTMSGWDAYVTLTPWVCIALLGAALSFASRWAPTLCLVAFVLAVVGIVVILVSHF